MLESAVLVVIDDKKIPKSHFFGSLDGRTFVEVQKEVSAGDEREVEKRLASDNKYFQNYPRETLVQRGAVIVEVK